MSLDSLFVVGVGCDLLGGCFLARGLLVKPGAVVERADSRVGSSPPVMASMIRARADGECGLITLGIGFLLQAAGYLALVAGEEPSTGGLRPWLSIVAALLAVGVILLISKHALPRRINQLARDVARADAARDREVTFELSLAYIGESLGYGPGPIDPRDVVAVRAYLQEHFGSV